VTKPAAKKEDSSDDSESESEDEKPKPPAKQVATKPTAQAKPAKKDDSSESESESEDEKPKQKTAPKSNGSEAMDVDASKTSGKRKAEDTSFSANKKAKAVSAVLLGNLSFDATDADIKSFLEEQSVGTVERVQMNSNPRGTAYVVFQDQESIQNALALNGTQFMERRLNVQEADSVPEPQACLEAFVGGLPYDVEEKNFKEYLGIEGIKSIRWIMDKNTGEFRGSAFVLFTDEESLQKALEFNGQEFNGRYLRVNKADEKPPKRGNDGGFRGGRGNDRGGRGGFRGGRGGNRGGRGGNFRGNSGGFRSNGFGAQNSAPSNTKVVFDD